MTEQKQPEALRIATTLDALDDFQFNKAAAELRRQHAEIESLRARLEALAKQKPFAYRHHSGVLFKQLAPGVSGLPLYLAVGARPVEPVQKLRPDFIAGYDAGMADAKRIQAAGARPVEPAPAGEYPPLPEWSKMDNLGGLVPSEIRRELRAYIDADRAMRAAQPVPVAQADAKDAARWRYAVAIGENQAMNWLDVYNDWDGEGSFVDAIDAALEASKKEQS